MERLIDKYPYLKALEHPLDEQQLKVCCRTDNTIVAAGAGSGKTQVLATRFAWLVMEKGIPASKILTLTYTKKAAAEMYSRIYDTLNKFATEEGIVIGNKQRLNAQMALADFANVHIQTLDSYCGSILRMAANRYGIRPDFTSGSSDARKNAEDLALPFILKNRNNIGIQHFAKPGMLQDFSSNVFAKIISQYTTLASPPDIFSINLINQCVKVQDEWNLNIRKFEKSLSAILAYINEHAADFYSDESKREQYDKLIQLLDNKDYLFKEIPEENFIYKDDNELKSYIILFESFLKEWSDFKLRDLRRKDFIKGLKEMIKESQEGLTALFLSLIAFIKDLPYIKELCLLLQNFLQEINDAKRASGALEFSDISELALKILIEQKDIRKQEKNAFDKIMIDEFQDNNGKNRDLLFLLSEAEGEDDLKYQPFSKEPVTKRIVKDKLFFVGDEKQSIYKFRGADVAVFNELKKDLAEINGPESFLQMIYNYRSVPELLSSFNILFGGYAIKDGQWTDADYNSIFLKESDKYYEALYPLSAVAKFVNTEHEEEKPVALNKANIKTHLKLLKITTEFMDAVSNNEILSKENQIMYSIARQIYELHTKKNIDYSKIAILDKSRAKRSYLTSWLERFNIPYNLDAQAYIFSEAPVNDIYNFFRLCVYPSDKKAFASFICSPFTGLVEADLEKILAVSIDYENPDFVFNAFDPSYDEKIKEIFEKDSVEYKRYFAAKDFFTQKQELVLAQEITKSLTMLWYDCGYYYESILNKNLNIFEEQYDLLFEIARTADLDGKGLAWFIDELAIIKENEKRATASESSDLNTKEVSYPLERSSAVKVMTIHKSKGLQFDYVFVLGCIVQPNSEKSSDFYYDEDFGVSFTPEKGVRNYFFDRLKNLSAEKESAELRRVIYVAATRAVKELYFYGHFKLTKAEDSIKMDLFFTPIIEQFYPDYTKKEFTKDYAENAPFDLEILSWVAASVYKDTNSFDIDCLRKLKIEKAEKWIEKANVITKPELESKRLSPSSLEMEYDADKAREFKNSHGELKDLYPEIDKIIEKYKSVFSFSDFGTLVHFYLEKTVKNQSEEEIFFDAKKMMKKLGEKDQELLHKICISVCKTFMLGKAGKALLLAKEKDREYSAEHEFKSFKDGKIITGAIDLYFQNEDSSITIVDYKTDHVINEEVYKEQQLCYKNAVCDLYNLPEEKVNCLLYYIRYDLLVNVG